MAVPTPKPKQHVDKVKESIKEEAEECMVCMQAFDAKRVKVVCPFCEEGKASACRTCTEKYLIGAVQDPHCMQCKHDWGIVYVTETFPKAFVTGTYRKSRQEK